MPQQGSKVQLRVSWGKCTGGNWCEFNKVDLSAQTFDGGGVYIIWHGGAEPRVVYVGQGCLPFGVVEHCCRCGQQAGRGQGLSWGPVDGLPGSCAELAGMLADQRLRGRFGEVPGAGPSDAEHRCDDAEVGEVGGGVLGRMAGLEHGEHAPLEREHFGREPCGFRPGGVALAEPLPAGLSRASPDGRAGPGLAALGRVRAAVADLADQRPAIVNCQVVPRAAALKRDPVVGAGEGDQELPGQFPASAEFLLNGLPSPAKQRGQ
jgi:hypothetical protein